jgi:isocitrate dehydrogenase
MFEKISQPTLGQKIQMIEGKLTVPDNPVIPYIAGDGIGPDILNATIPTIDAAVEKAYGGRRKITWFKVYAGDEARDYYHPGLSDEALVELPIEEQRNVYLPLDTLKAIKEYLVTLKGPLTTPIGGGFRSLNVGIRQKLDLYACVRPVRYFEGVPTRVKHPEEVDMVIFRENSEDVYSGIEFRKDDKDQKIIYELLKYMGKDLRVDSGIGVKPISETGSKRLVRAAIRYALDKNLPSVTLVHKGNIMKYTEGAFKDWGYEVGVQEFRQYVITEEELWDKYDGKMPEGKKLVIKDRIADIIFQHILLRSSEFSVLATMNLNGDYISDAAAAMVGGLGMAPGANINYDTGIIVAEATHGTAPKYTGMDKVNPSSVMLSAVIMLDYMGWGEAAELIIKGIQGAISNKEVTYDLARQMGDVPPIKCSEFGMAVVRHM